MEQNFAPGLNAWQPASFAPRINRAPADGDALLDFGNGVEGA
jgi:hypothetical protein